MTSAPAPYARVVGKPTDGAVGQLREQAAICTRRWRDVEAVAAAAGVS